MSTMFMMGPQKGTHKIPRKARYERGNLLPQIKTKAHYSQKYE